MISVLQLTKNDVPELGFPEGKNLFQLMWCPNQDHDECNYAPFSKCFWRQYQKGNGVQLLPKAQVPQPGSNADDFVMPKICSIAPERVAEYPDYCEVEEADEELVQNIENWIQDHSAVDVHELGLREGENCYQYSWSVSPSDKVGGYVNWVQATDFKTCEGCGQTMEHLLSIASLGGYGGGGSKRWYPLNEARKDALKGHKMSVNGGGMYYIFICRLCLEKPIKCGSQRWPKAKTYC